MQANLQRYMMAASLAVRLALAIANGAAQPHPESLPAVSSLPPSAPAGSAGAARAATERGYEGGRSGRVVKGPPLTLYRGEVRVLDLPNVARIAVGHCDVLRAETVSSSQVVLIARAAGSTTLCVWTHDGSQFTYDVAVPRFEVTRLGA